jgi:hypothetical protein
MVIGEFTRQAPGRRAARLLLATGPVAGLCWATALIASRAWTWPVPATARLSFGAVPLLAVLVLLAAATSRHSYQRTRLAMLASPVILALDMTAVTTAGLAAPALTWALGTAVAVSLGRMVFTAWTLPASPPAHTRAGRSSCQHASGCGATGSLPSSSPAGRPRSGRGLIADTPPAAGLPVNCPRWLA